MIVSPDITWKPNKKQEELLMLPDSVFEALYGGAAGGGKSEVLIVLPLARAFHENPRFKGIIFRRTYKELDDEIIPRSRHWYAPSGARYNESKKRWIWPSGAVMQFGHMQYEEDCRLYDSAEYNYIAFDELTSFLQSQYVYVSTTRCRTSSPDLPAFVRAASNPGNIGHHWVRERFVDPAPAGTLVRDTVSKSKRIFIPAKVDDNPHVDPGYAARLELLPEAERRAKKDGDWYTFDGQVFDEFRERHKENEPENAVHVIPPREVPIWWPRVLAIDWGFTAMTYALWAAITPNDRVLCYREYGIKKAKISEWATRLGVLSQGEEYKDIVLCQSAWQDKGEELTIADQLKKYSGLKARRADNNRVLGKQLIQEYLRWKPKPNSKSLPVNLFDAEQANGILRNKGLEAYKQYYDSFQPEVPEDNLPKLQIFSTLRLLIETLPKCLYKNKDRLTGKPAEDVQEFEGDDPYDNLRYLIEAVNQHIHHNKSEHTFRTEVDDILNEVAATNDQTRFYRRMNFVEAKSPKLKPVHRRSQYRRAS